MKACIAVVQYRPIEDVPPVYSLLLALKKSGRPVHFISVESDVGRKFCQDNDIPYTFFSRPCWVYGSIALMNRPFAKVYRAISFICKRLILIKQLNALKKTYGDVVVWNQEMHSAALGGDVCRRKFPRQIITLFELYDTYGRNWLGFNYLKALQDSRIVCCEMNRAKKLKEYYKLDKLPYVIPNKPIISNRERNQPVTDNVESVFNQIGDRPCFIYQGIWGEGRQDVALVLETIAANRPNYCVLSMPSTPGVEERLNKYPNAFTLPKIPAPRHLTVTSHATVGIAIYRDVKGDSLYALNEQYCAPNKIYEYACFGIPTLGNKVVGLIDSIGKAKAGICCDMTKESILDTADKLVNNLEDYKMAALKFYDKISIESCIEEVLNDHEAFN